jgi:hypothetical protein
MKYRNEVPGIAGVELSPWEASQLWAFLEPMTRDADPHEAPDTLEVVFDKLDDAAALAHWLRENAVLELPADGAVQLLTVLETHLTADDHGPAGRSPALDAVREKLNRSLASLSVLATSI